MRTIPFIGHEFNNFIPIMVIGMALFTIWKEGRQKRTKMMIIRQLNEADVSNLVVF